MTNELSKSRKKFPTTTYKPHLQVLYFLLLLLKSSLFQWQKKCESSYPTFASSIDILPRQENASFPLGDRSYLAYLITAVCPLSNLWGKVEQISSPYSIISASLPSQAIRIYEPGNANGRPICSRSEAVMYRVCILGDKFGKILSTNRLCSTNAGQRIHNKGTKFSQPCLSEAELSHVIILS